MNLIWLRTSVRLLDNPAWGLATLETSLDTPHCVLLTPTPEQYRTHGYGPRKIDPWLAQFNAFAETLRALGVNVELHSVPTYREAAAWVLSRATALGARTVIADREYGLNERRRDAWLGKRLNAQNIALTLTNDRVTFAPESLLTGQGQPFKVYTAYKNAWRKQWSSAPQYPYPRPTWATQLPAPEEEAQSAMADFVAQDLKHYSTARNDITQPVVSGLSPLIANGLLTTRQAFAAAAEQRIDAEQWLNEWIWREFFHAVAWHFPEIYRHRPLQPWTDLVPWSDDQALFSAWCEGRTGYPVVDAAMRQLKSTGQMPNRARMFASAFLTKDLHLDWRLGEAWFLAQLNDADFVANNGNWQWGASTGVDAAPYFRVFNPLRQGEKFDPNGDYVRTWVTELADLPGKSIHNPSPLERAASGYPDPLVIHADAATRIKALFKQAKDLNNGQQNDD
ncbi:cryptochrome/photolyase family protein [Salinispirillum marinum]|uniref:Cryptochrome/photolyase family protein n=2 Tax=Saccharospirillaceae TaxID=255527 RepID=A0ABV8BG83_9GAMM